MAARGTFGLLSPPTHTTEGWGGEPMTEDWITKLVDSITLIVLETLKDPNQMRVARRGVQLLLAFFM